jgi:uncharacterized membrane protein YkgB
VERETGIEPATSSLGSWHSTTELLPLVIAVTAEIVTLCFVLAEPQRFPNRDYILQVMAFQFASHRC